MTAVLKAETREAKKSVARRLRRQGYIPAVLYGHGIENQTIYVDGNAFAKLYRDIGRTGIFTLEVQNESYPVMIYDMQYDAIKNNVIHVDFFKVNMDEEVDAEVPIQLVGESPGEKAGGVIQHNLNMIEVRALPKDLPQSIDVSIDELNIGDAITVGDLKAKSDGKYTILNDDEEVIVTVLAPSGAGAAEEASEEETEAKEESAEESSDQ